MQVMEVTNEGLKRAYKIVVPADDIERRLTERLSEIARNARMPGFRPGKVPVSLLRKTYGSAVKGEVLEKTVNEVTQQAIDEKEVRPVGQPKVEIEKFEDGGDLEYNIELEVFPEITIADLSEIEIERLKIKPDEEQVERFLLQMADSQKDSESVTEDRPVAEGDVAVIDFVGKVDGEEFAGGKAEDYRLEIGSGAFIPGFEEQLVGAKVGDELTVKVTFPDNYAEQLAGKEAEFGVTVKELRAPKPVAIDDELAKKMGVDSLEEMKNTLRASQERELGQHSRQRLKRDLLDILDKKHSFELPEGMVEAEFESIWHQLEHTREHHPEQLDEDDRNKSDEELKAQYREIAERRVRLGLLLAEIGRINDIKVTPEEISRAIVQEAQKYRGQEKEVVEYYRNNPEAAAQLQSPILEDKVVDFVLEIAQVTDKEVTTEELLELERADSGGESDAEAAAPAGGKAAAKGGKSKAKGGGKKADTAKSE